MGESSTIKSSVIPLLGAALLVALSVELVRVKGAKSAFEAELHANTQAFLPRDELPDLTLQFATGHRSLPDVCLDSAPVVVYMSMRQCGKCAEINPVWERMAHKHTGVTFLNLHLDSHAERLRRDDPILHASVVPSEVVRTLRVDQVPAILVTDASCRIRAAGAGVHSALFALRTVDTRAR